MILFDPLAIRDVIIGIVSALAGFVAAILGLFKKKG